MTMQVVRSGMNVAQLFTAHLPEATFTTHVNDCASVPLTIVSRGVDPGEFPGIKLDLGQHEANKE